MVKSVHIAQKCKLLSKTKAVYAKYFSNIEIIYIK